MGEQPGATTAQGMAQQQFGLVAGLRRLAGSGFTQQFVDAGHKRP